MTKADIQKLILSRVVSVKEETDTTNGTQSNPIGPTKQGEGFTPHGTINHSYTPHGPRATYPRNPTQHTPETTKTPQRANTAGFSGEQGRATDGVQMPMMKRGNCWVNETGTIRIDVLHGAGFGYYPWVRTVSGSLWVTNTKGLTVPFDTPHEAIEAGLLKARGGTLYT